MKDILNKVKQYSKKGLLSLAITLAVASSVSAQTTDTIKFLDNVITINDVKTNREYYQAILSLIEDEEAKKDTVGSEALEEVKMLYKGLIIGLEVFNLNDLSPQAEKIENKLQQYLINNPEKVQFHINKGKKFSKGETDPLDFEPDPDFSKPFPGEPGYKSNKKLDETKVFSKD